MQHATLGRIGDNRAMAFEPAIAHTDDFSEMSFTDLESLADDLSESSQWSLLDDVRAELADRKRDAEHALARLFIVAMENAHAPSTPKVPTVSRDRIEQQPISVVVLQHLEEVMATDAVLRTYCAGPEAMRAAWAEHVARMGKDYAEASAEDLLRAGWSE